MNLALSASLLAPGLHRLMAYSLHPSALHRLMASPLATTVSPSPTLFLRRCNQGGIMARACRLEVLTMCWVRTSQSQQLFNIVMRSRPLLILPMRSFEDLNLTFWQQSSLQHLFLLIQPEPSPCTAHRADLDIIQGCGPMSIHLMIWAHLMSVPTPSYCRITSTSLHL